MKSFAILCAALLVAGIAASATAGEHVSKSTLASMGFGSVQVMSDADGDAVRGKGWFGPSYGTSASVSGSSTANYWGHSGNATASNQYSASSKHKFGPASAQGESNSFAGTEYTKSFGNHTVTTTFYIVSGGGASASAH
jgi:hypothetical protein